MTSRLTGHSKLGGRATLSGGLGAACALAAPVLGIRGTGRAQGAPWPTRPVTMVVGFPPGGQTDFAARVVQPGLSAALGQTVVIDNRGGANGNLATEAVLRARADGYTLLMGREATQAINPHVLPGAAIDPLRLTPIGVRAALTKCPSEAAGLSGRGGAKVYRGAAFFGLVHDGLGKAKGCSRWSSTDGCATPAMSRG